MKLHFVDQGSAEWYRLRLGIPTASQFHKIITPAKGDLSTQARPYMYRLIAERLLKDSMDDQLTVEWVERGKVEQHPASQQFALVTENALEPIGFITTDDGRLGASPDYLVRKRNECVEIKCPAPWTQIGYLLDGPAVEYRPQVQGQLLVGEFDAAHFYSYHPRMPAKHVVTLRDEAYLDKMRMALDSFLTALDIATNRARQLGAYVETIRAETPLDRSIERQDELTIVLPDGGTILDGG
jgi:hypothetical protein